MPFLTHLHKVEWPIPSWRAKGRGRINITEFMISPKYATQTAFDQDLIKVRFSESTCGTLITTSLLCESQVGGSMQGFSQYPLLLCEDLKGAY